MRVESWAGGNLKRYYGRLDQFDVAVGAFDGAVKAFPDEHITMRERARIIREHIPETKKPAAANRAG